MGIRTELSSEIFEVLYIIYLSYDLYPMYSVCVYVYTGTIVLYMASVQYDSYVIGKFIEYNIFIF